MALEVGNTIDGRCGRCKWMLRHTIEAIAAEKIKRVVVTGTRDRFKIDILFADGAKVLQQGC